MNINSTPWPNKGDELFKADTDGYHNAVLNCWGDSLESYIAGYKRAADLLVGYIKDSHNDQDILVFPIVFLYRQYVELRLKDIIKNGNHLLDNQLGYSKSHNLLKLWESCRKIIEKLWPKGTPEDLDAVEECIMQFSEEDPESTAFRYPTNKKGEASLPNRLYINLRNVSDVITKVSGLLDGTSYAIAHYLDYKKDEEAEYNNEF